MLDKMALSVAKELLEKEEFDAVVNENTTRLQKEKAMRILGINIGKSISGKLSAKNENDIEKEMYYNARMRAIGQIVQTMHVNAVEQIEQLISAKSKEETISKLISFLNDAR